MALTGTFLAFALDAISRRGEATSSLASAVKSVLRYPIKALAVFLTAPILAVRVAFIAKNPIRRVVAVVGLLLAIGFAWLAGTFLGTVVGAIFVASHVGVLVGLGFLVGSLLSVVLSVAFCLLVFNGTCWLFLHMSSEEVVEHLRSTSSP